MPILPILVVPDPLLRRKAAPVPVVDGRVRALFDSMLATMYAAPGIGLAAPQIGRLDRLVVVDVAREGEPARPLRLANPEVLWRSDETGVYNEGCLSLPEMYADVERPLACRVRFLDETGAERVLEADGLLARCLQHEIDHLDGVLFIDHISALKRSMILRKLQKARRTG